MGTGLPFIFTRSVNKTPIMKTKMNYLTATLLAIFAWGGTGVGMAKQSKKALRHPVEDNKKSPGVYDANQNDRQGIQDAEQSPGDKPVTWSISRPNAKNALSEVTKGIYQIHGGGFPNITIIEGREGIMIIAPFVPKETMARVLTSITGRRENGQSRLL